LRIAIVTNRFAPYVGGNETTSDRRIIRVGHLALLDHPPAAVSCFSDRYSK